MFIGLWTPLAIHATCFCQKAHAIVDARGHRHGLYALQIIVRIYAISLKHQDINHYLPGATRLGLLPLAYYCGDFDKMLCFLCMTSAAIPQHLFLRTIFLPRFIKISVSTLVGIGFEEFPCKQESYNAIGSSQLTDIHSDETWCSHAAIAAIFCDEHVRWWLNGRHLEISRYWSSTRVIVIAIHSNLLTKRLMQEIQFTQ